MKTYLKILAAFSLLGASSLPTSAALLVVDHYRLGEADPGAADGVAGNATTFDSGPAGGAGALIKTATTTYSNSVGSTASSSTGSTLSMDLASGGYYSSATTSITATNNWGMELWFKLDDATNGFQIPVYNGAGNGGSQDGAGFYVDPNGLLRIFYGGVLDESTGFTVTDNTWNYVAVVRDGGVNTFYINSTTANTMFNSAANNAATTGFAIGTEGKDFSSISAGSFDEVRTFTFTSGQFDASTDLLIAVPEPSAFVLIGLALSARLFRRSRRS